MPRIEGKSIFDAVVEDVGKVGWKKETYRGSI